MYFAEIDADKLECRSLFMNGVKLDMAEDWESLDWLFFFSPKLLAVGIAVPWLEVTCIFSFDVKCFAFLKY